MTKQGWILAGAVLALAITAPAQGRGRRGAGRASGLAPNQVDLDAPNSYNAAAAARGQALFDVQCASCHGPDARGATRGGPGKAQVDLIRSAMVLDDLGGQEIGEFLKYGRPEKNMPAFPALTAAQVGDIATFLHRTVADAAYRFDYKTINDLNGNAQAGAVYFAAHCSGCHSATGDMKGIAAQAHDDAPTIQSLIVNGGSRFSARGAVTGTVTLENGQTFTGAPVEVSDFVVSLKLPDGATRSWLRDGEWPRYTEHDPLAAHHQLALQFSDADIHNLAAFLATLN